MAAASKKLYAMKEACEQTGLPYETLKYYCNTGLVPNVKRLDNNRRVFDDHDIAWIKSLTCLKKCGMTIEEMKQYLAYCCKGPIPFPSARSCSIRSGPSYRKSCRKSKNPSTISTGNRISTTKSRQANGSTPVTSCRNITTTIPATNSAVPSCERPG